MLGNLINATTEKLFRRTTRKITYCFCLYISKNDLLKEYCIKFLSKYN